MYQSAAPSKLTIIGSLLPQPLQQLGIAEQVKNKRVARAWRDIVGSHITNYARPVRVYGNTLYVRVCNTTWMQELNYHKGRFIQKINDYLGQNEITDIYLELGDLPPLPPPEINQSVPPPWLLRELPAEFEEEIEHKLSNIPEGEIKERARRIMSNHYKLHRIEENSQYRK